MIRVGYMRCLRGFPHRKRTEYVFVYHSGKDFIFEIVTKSQLKPTLIVAKRDVISIDLLVPNHLEKMCNSMVDDAISGEMVFGSAHLFMDGAWYNDTIKTAAVKRILCVTYKGKIEESIETIYLTARKHNCKKMYKKMMDAWKAPPEYYRVYPEGDAEESTYRYMGEY